MTHPDPGHYTFGRDRHDQPAEPSETGPPVSSQVIPGRAALRRQREARRPIAGHSSLKVVIPLSIAAAFMLIWTGASLTVTLEDMGDGDSTQTNVGIFMTAASILVTIGLSAWLLGVLRRRRAHRRDQDHHYQQVFGHHPDDGTVEDPAAQYAPGAAALRTEQAADLTTGLDRAAQSSFHGVPPPPPGFKGAVALAISYVCWAASMVYTAAFLGVMTEDYSAGAAGDAAGMLFFLVPGIVVNIVLLARIITIHRRRSAYRRILNLKYEELFGHSPHTRS